MKIYLAARYSRNAEMRGVRDVLQTLGHHITSRWIDCHAGKYLTSFTPEHLNNDPEYCSAIARHDWDDLSEADTVISFTDTTGGGKGGRHVEFGLSLALGKRSILVGPRENVFHTLPEIEHYPSWFSCVVALSTETRAMSEQR
jgi:hypothetical protein